MRKARTKKEKDQPVQPNVETTGENLDESAASTATPPTPTPTQHHHHDEGISINVVYKQTNKQKHKTHSK